MANSYAKFGAATGLLLVTSAFAVNLAPQIIAGQNISGTLDTSKILSFYNHPEFAGIYFYWSLTSFYLIGLGVALWYTLKGAGASSRTEVWLLSAVALVVAEATLVIVQAALQTTLVTIAGAFSTATSDAARAGLGAAALSTFRLWDIIWNSLLYQVEAGWILFFSLVILKTRVFGHWVGYVGLAAASLQVLNAASIPLDLPTGLTFPGNIAFAVWLVGVSISFLRLKSEA